MTKTENIIQFPKELEPEFDKRRETIIAQMPTRPRRAHHTGRAPQAPHLLAHNVGSNVARIDKFVWITDSAIDYIFLSGRVGPEHVVLVDPSSAKLPEARWIIPHDEDGAAESFAPSWKATDALKGIELDMTEAERAQLADYLAADAADAADHEE
jgi:hypothetical protein